MKVVGVTGNQIERTHEQDEYSLCEKFRLK